MLRIYFVGLLILFVTASAQAQNTSGLTGVRDTSFSNASAYVKARKKHPDIKLVQEFSRLAVREKRNVVYSSAGNRELRLDAFFPRKKHKAKASAILLIHGGGWRSGSRQQHIPLAQRLAELGYVCFTADYRLSTEALYPAPVHDLRAAVRWIRENAKRFNLDTAQITALGFSSGGELAAFLGSTNHDSAYAGQHGRFAVSGKVQAVVDIDGILSFVHPESGEGDDSRATSAATYWFGYSKSENPALWQEASPLTHVDRNTPPFLFLNSSVDRMHAGRNDFRKVLSRHGIYSEVHTFSEAPHTFPLFAPWFEPTVGFIDAFLKKVYKR
ncbi:alpha/beta hydrolase [Hymenobacter actinosclerus]|uniref:Acetyl esterase/lipase n=1 Tax=Hymenobacter actinosclerus TaxID=82805 RepID=A0A1I0F4B1_9BACT|nr:alpha/beta hydrolase [Hymenobacter actinosclerus]SET52661.1 Acetyl esterase/lipase [Hymenobacter actinosclerus]